MSRRCLGAVRLWLSWRVVAVAFAVAALTSFQTTATAASSPFPTHARTGTDTTTTSTTASTASTTTNVLLLDVDNTLYCESDLSRGIEAQIVRNIHSYCQRECNLTAQHADQLHRQYGSTVEGLRQTLWKDVSPAELAARMKQLYDQVYATVDVSALLASTDRGSSGSTSSNTNVPTSTGYSHSKTVSNQHLLRRILLQSPTTEQLHLASNSPLPHVAKVIQALGLARVPWTAVWTPDRTAAANGAEAGSSKKLVADRSSIYPTKADPKAFFDTLLAQKDNGGSKKSNRKGRTDEYRVVLLDDSPAALSAASQHVSGVIQVTRHRPLQTALAVVNDWIREDETYSFSQVDYLLAKNAVDFESVHAETYALMAAELGALLSKTREQSLCIVDVGAGILSMLRLVVQGHERRLPALLGLVQQEQELQLCTFYAYEPNQALQDACQQELGRLGFVLREVFHWESSSSSSQHLSSDNQNDDNGGESFDPELIFIREAEGNLPKIEVHLRMFDYEQHTKRPQPTPHLIMGCCFADLVEPYDLTKALLRRFLSSSSSSSSDPSLGAQHTETLVYFPITFQGITQFVPPCSLEEWHSPMIPSDTTAFSLYSRALREQHGHHLDPFRLEEAMADYGATRLARASSDWLIDADEHAYLWETMLYFFGTVAAPQLRLAKWNDKQWLARARHFQPSIQVSNVDLLFRLPHLGHWEGNDGIAVDLGPLVMYDEIQFTAPYQVHTVQKKAANLGPNEVRVRSVCSLISSGTELKIFKGIFDEAEAELDVNIKGMDESRLAYPLSYGYSMVGRVVECGKGVKDAESLVGQLVFSFSAHASQIVADRSSLQIVPEGIDPLDAVFMPSIETALALVHDANPRMGEKVAVFGQGVIGLLVTLLLSRLGINQDTFASAFGALTTFDAVPQRLAASAYMGATQALLPSEAQSAGPFDVAIEVSGHGSALQSAIDSTADGGRIILGSWYGNAAVSLKLGLDFHRSHKTLISSQVSEIPAALRATWSKERRFAFAWDLIREVRPSRLITMKTTLEKAQDAYIHLDNGKEIAGVFEYK